jgi:hypothetical protein
VDAEGLLEEDEGLAEEAEEEVVEVEVVGEM